MSHSRKTTRREFLASSSATTGAAFAAAYGASFVPASALRREGHTAPSERVRMGCIGSGRQCYHKNMPLFARTGDVQAMAVCDVDTWRSENAVRQVETQYTSGRAKGTFSKVDQHVDYQELLARDDIDAVMISTPDHWHCTMALDAMKAGNVLLTFQIKYKFADGADGLEWIYRTEKPYFLIEGDEGWVRADFSELDAEPNSLLTLNLEKAEQGFPLQGEKENFIASVPSRQSTLEPAEVGHRVTSLGLLGHIAINTDRKLQGDPVQEVFVNDDAANKYLDTPILHRPQVG